MKLDFSRLKLHPRESEVFYLQAKGDNNLWSESGGKFLAPLEVRIEVENTGTLFIGRGNLKTTVQLPCARCLKEFTCPVETDFEITLIENSQSGNYSPDEGFIFFEGNEAEIGPAVEEAVFMAIPISPLCRENCQGLCPICGQDQNSAPCSCGEENIDPRWEKLKDLN